MTEQMFQGDPFGAQKADKQNSDAPSARVVNKFHEKSDADVGPTSQHHTIGVQRAQAASGAHNHNGDNSKKIGAGMGLTVTGAKAGNAALTSLLAMLASVVEFTDSTT